MLLVFLVGCIQFAQCMDKQESPASNALAIEKSSDWRRVLEPILTGLYLVLGAVLLHSASLIYVVCYFMASALAVYRHVYTQKIMKLFFRNRVEDVAVVFSLVYLAIKNSPCVLATFMYMLGLDFPWRSVKKITRSKFTATVVVVFFLYNHLSWVTLGKWSENPRIWITIIQTLLPMVIFPLLSRQKYGTLKILCIYLIAGQFLGEFYGLENNFLQQTATGYENVYNRESTEMEYMRRYFGWEKPDIRSTPLKEVFYAAGLEEVLKLAHVLAFSSFTTPEERVLFGVASGLSFDIREQVFYLRGARPEHIWGQIYRFFLPHACLTSTAARGVGGFALAVLMHTWTNYASLNDLMSAKYSAAAILVLALLLLKFQPKNNYWLSASF